MATPTSGSPTTINFASSAQTSYTTGPIFTSASGSTTTAVSLIVTTTDATDSSDNGDITWSAAGSVTSWSQSETVSHNPLTNQGVSKIFSFTHNNYFITFFIQPYQLTCAYTAPSYAPSNYKSAQCVATPSTGSATTMNFANSAQTSFKTGPIFTSASGSTTTAVSLVVTTTDATDSSTNGDQTWTAAGSVTSWSQSETVSHTSLTNQGVRKYKITRTKIIFFLFRITRYLALTRQLVWPQLHFHSDNVL